MIVLLYIIQRKFYFLFSILSLVAISVLFYGNFSAAQAFVAYALLGAVSLYLYRRQISWQLGLWLTDMLSTQPSAGNRRSNWLQLLIEPLEQRLHHLVSERNMAYAAFNAISDAVIRTDADGQVRAVNRACLKLFNCDRHALLHKSYNLCQRALKVTDAHVDFNDILAKLARGDSQERVFSSIFHVEIKGRVFAIERQISAIYQNGNFAGTVVMLRDVTKAEKLRKRLRFQANHDNVTKLYNRYKFDQRLTDAWHDVKQDERQHALLLLDMDRFKLINDNAGHASGDQLLRNVAELLRANIRATDVCARIGGDEFSVLLYDVDTDVVEQIMTKLNLAFENLQFASAGQVFDVGASIGATLINKNSPSIADVKRQADSACFIAKNKGINSHQLFSQQDEQLMNIQQEPRWAARIHQALESDEFVLFYQTIQALDTSSNSKQHIEILLRLKSGDKMLSPSLFLPAVERFRLTDKVDFWVISKVFSWFEQKPTLWQKQVLAINLSGESLTNEEFIDNVISLFSQCHFPAEAICFEVTETAAIGDMAIARRLVDKLSAVGFNIALDDFGKGFSTFNYLKNLPAQYIKIDGSYVEEMLISENDFSIVKAIASMAKSMEMKTIAEFVQCDKTMEALDELGVDFVQGYGIEHPKPLADYRH